MNNSKEALPEKMDFRSMDITAENRTRIKDLFPSVFTEIVNEKGELVESIDYEKLKAELGTFSEVFESRRERYGMDWNGKKDCMKLIQQPSIGTLKPCREESVNFDSTENLFIEGDNLEVLKLLQKSYYGKVKMIYIDPPYNTGKEFIYPDNYSESLDTYLAYAGLVDDDGKKFSTNTPNEGRFHTKWLNMMYPRLYLARNLLVEDGTIFISIDDNELKNLRFLCDELFGEENFIAHIIWQHSVQPKGYSQIFSVHHNHILSYRKGDQYSVQPLERTEKDNKNYSNPDNDPRGLWRTGDVRNALYRPNLIYDIVTPSGKIIPPPANGWRWSKETVQNKISTGEILFSQDETRIIRKIYLADQEGRAPETIWFSNDAGTTREASSELKELFDDQAPFDTSKPTRLIKRMLEVAGVSAGDICIDFFAGSCSTAHAVLKESDVHFIMIQLPEPVNESTPHGKVAKDLGLDTISKVGIERIRRAIKKVGTEPSENGQLDLGCRVFKLDQSNFKIWDGSNPSSSEQEIAKQLTMHVDHVLQSATQEDILFELLIKSGFTPTEKVEKLEMAGKTVFSIADGALLICLEDKITRELIDEVAKAEPMQFICLDKGFKGNDQLKSNTVQTFAARNQGRDKAEQIVFKTV